MCAKKVTVAQPTDDSPATLALLAAIEANDVEGIRRAAKAGASLSVFNSKGRTPFVQALYHFRQPNGSKCARLLAELGAPCKFNVNGTPTIFACVGGLFNDRTAATMIETIILPLGIDVNAQDSAGTTALMSAALQRSKVLTQFLMQHGADPKIKNCGGDTALSLVTKMQQCTLRKVEREQYEEIISLLSGKEYKPSAIGKKYKPSAIKPLPPKLAAEMERLRACNTATTVLNFMRSRRSAAEIAAAEKTLATPKIFVGGKPALFERVGFYMNVSDDDEDGEDGLKDSQMSTATLAKGLASALKEGEGDDSRAYARWKGADTDSKYRIQSTLDYKVFRAVNLVGMRHLQFAGAPKKNDFLAAGCEAAKALFRILGSKGFRKLYTDDIERLMDGLLMGALAGRWDDFEELCNLVPPRLASVKPQDVDELTMEHANAILCFASDFRGDKMPGVAKMEQFVLNGRPKRPKQLLKIWQAVRDNDATAFRTALEASITDVSNRKRDIAFHNMPRTPLAVDESVMCMAAKRRGMEMPALDESLADYLVTKDSIKYCEHD
jgi:hypothetical protein